MTFWARLFSKNVIISGEKAESKINHENYYLTVVNCKNCGNNTKVYIKKKVYINDVIGTIKCHYCDCRLTKE